MNFLEDDDGDDNDEGQKDDPRNDDVEIGIIRDTGTGTSQRELQRNRLLRSTGCVDSCYPGRIVS